MECRVVRNLEVILFFILSLLKNIFFGLTMPVLAAFVVAFLLRSPYSGDCPEKLKELNEFTLLFWGTKEIDAEIFAFFQERIFHKRNGRCTFKRSTCTTSYEAFHVGDYRKRRLEPPEAYRIILSYPIPYIEGPRMFSYKMQYTRPGQWILENVPETLRGTIDPHVIETIPYIRHVERYDYGFGRYYMRYEKSVLCA